MKKGIFKLTLIATACLVAWTGVTNNWLLTPTLVLMALLVYMAFD